MGVDFGKEGVVRVWDGIVFGEVGGGVDGGGEDEMDVGVFDYVGGCVLRVGFEIFVGDGFEVEEWVVVGCGLFGVVDLLGYVVIVVEVVGSVVGILDGVVWVGWVVVWVGVGVWDGRWGYVYKLKLMRYVVEDKF